MLVSENKLTHQRYFPYKEGNILEVDDNKENIICPFCKENVIFVCGAQKIIHFRHFTKSECSPEPETEEHIKMKQFFIDNLKLNKDSIEINLGFARPNIYLSKRRIAIEVQHSSISAEKFLERTTNYTKNGIYVLWVFDSCLCKKRVSKLLRKAHELYFGRVYLFEKDKIIPTHFQPVQKWVEKKDIPVFTDKDEWIANGCQTIYDTVGGYYKTLKTEKNFVFDDEIVTFNEFYILLTQNTWKNNNFLIAKLNDLRFWK